MSALLRLGLLLALVASLGAAALGGRWAWAQGEQFQRELGLAAAAAETASRDPGGALVRVRQHLLAARAALDALRPVAAPTAALASQAASLPVVGPPARQAAALWEFADAGTSLGLQLVTAGRLGLASVEGGASSARLVAAAPSLHAAFQAAQGSFARAQSARAGLGTLDGPLAPYQPYLARWDAAAPALDDALHTATTVSGVLPRLLGSDRPLTYLVLVQTNEELRATGGVITSIGILRVADGRIAEATFQKVNAAEPPYSPNEPWIQPPYPLVHHMGIGAWLLRDANWWADFPATARQAATFWEDAQGGRLDGVIALNEAVLDLLLDATGPLRLPDGRVVTTRNVQDLALAQIFNPANTNAIQWQNAQSAFSQDLGTVLLRALERLPSDRWPALAGQLRGAAARHDLLVASFDPTVAVALRELRLDGALSAERDDYVYLVERNLSYAKLSPFITWDAEYTVELGPDGAPVHARLAVDAANTYVPGRGVAGYPAFYYSGGRWNWTTRQVELQEGYYGGYTSVYLPRGSQFLRASGFEEAVRAEPEGDLTAISGYVALPMGARRRLTVEWTPRVVPTQPGHYRLVLPRQPGAPAYALTVRVVLPEGARLTAATPAPASVDRAFDLALDAPAAARR